jgi:hypothetical protein
MLQQSHVPLTNGIMSFLQASEDYNLAPIGIGSMHEQAQKLAEFGRHGDIYFVHAAEGETVIPLEVLNANPKVKDMLFNQMREMGLDPDEFVVGNELNSINPVTGMPEFFFSSVWRGAKRAASSVWQGVRKAAPYVVPLVLSIYGVPGAGAGSMFGPGSFGAAFLGGGVGSLMAGKSMKESLRNAAIAGGTSALARGVSNINEPGGFTGGVERSFGVGEGGFSVYGDPYESGADVDRWGRRTETGFSSGDTGTGAPTPVEQRVITPPETSVGDMNYGPPAPVFNPATRVPPLRPPTPDVFNPATRVPPLRPPTPDVFYPATRVPPLRPPTPMRWPGAPVGSDYINTDFSEAYNWQDRMSSSPTTETTAWQDIKKGASDVADWTGDIMLRGGQSKTDLLNKQAAAVTRVENTDVFKDASGRTKNLMRQQAWTDAGKINPVFEYGPTLAAGYGLYKLSERGESPEERRLREIAEKEDEARKKYKRDYAIYGEDPGKYYVQLGLPPTTGVAHGGLAEYPRRDLLVEGRGTERSDDIPAMLSDGEFVMNSKSVRGADPSGRGNRYAGANNLYNMMRNFEMRT